jgi:ribosomal protein L18
MTGILGPTEPPADVEPPDQDCPQCQQPLEPDAQFDATLQYTCTSDDCEYFEVQSSIPFINTYLGRLRKLAVQLVWPYPVVLKRVQLALGIVLLAYGLFTAYPWTHGAVACITAFVWPVVLQPPEFCGACGVRIHDDAHRFCWNCGESVQSRVSYVDLDAEPRIQPSLHWLDGRLASNLSRSGLSIRYDTSNGDAFIAWLVRGRERLWRILFDIGIGLTAAVYGAVVWITATHVWQLLISTASSGQQSTAESSASSSLPKVDLAMPTITLEEAIAVGGLIAAVSLANYVSLIIHELGHGIGYYLHGHQVEEFSVSAIAGLIPTHGFTRGDVNVHANRALRAALHTTVGGVTLNALAASILAPVWYLAGAPGIESEFNGFLSLTITFLFGVNAASILNVVPVPGTDGDHFQQHFLQFLAERAGIENSLTVATYGSKTVFYGFLAAFLIGVFT